MMLEVKRFLLLAISLCWAVQESAADSSPKEEYSAFDSASWAITSSRLSPLLGTDKQSLYNNFIKGCDAAVKEKNGRENFCTFGERQRFEMNAMQPSSCYNYTEAGYAKTRAPPELYAEIKKFFDTHRDRSRIEWKDYNVYHNAWEAPPTFIDLLLNSALTRKIETVVQPILEQWTGQKLRPVSESKTYLDLLRYLDAFVNSLFHTEFPTSGTWNRFRRMEFDCITTTPFSLHMLIECH